MDPHLGHFFLFISSIFRCFECCKDTINTGIRQVSACKVTHRAIFDVYFGSENFQLSLMPVFIGLESTS